MLIKLLHKIITKHYCKIFSSVLFLLVLIIGGCAASDSNIDSERKHDIAVNSNTSSSESNGEFDLFEDEFAQEGVEVPDPLESFNRVMFFVNDKLYFWVIKPVTGLYTDVTPEPARVGIRNFFRNLTTPVRLGNCMFQGKWDSASTEFDRFMINSTFGILGIGDPALQEHNLKPVRQDMGQTLAHYGVENGFYIVLPLFGPSTLRDAAGKFGDSFLNPTSYIDHTETARSVSALKFTNEMSFRKGEYEDFKSSALDSYIAMRKMYLQYRKKLTTPKVSSQQPMPE